MLSGTPFLMALTEGLMTRRSIRSMTVSIRRPHFRGGAPATVAVLLGLAAASLFATGFDRPDPTPDGVTIPYGDLDLSTIEGALELERRLVEAASAVCAGLDSAAVPPGDFDRCRMDAVGGAILILRRPPSAAALVSS
jgi:UrcA family protein